MKRILDFFAFVDRAFAGAVQALLISILIFLTGLVFLQVVLRNALGGGIGWADVVADNMVFWLGFLGTMYPIFGIVFLCAMFASAGAIQTLLISVLLFLKGLVFFLKGLVFFQELLRNALGGGIGWADVVARHTVLWIAFLGAMLATRSRRHIAIDIITRMIPRRPRNAVRIALDAFACAVSLGLARAALGFVLAERAMGTELVSGLPAWIAQAIIPFGFAMIGIEYAIGIALDIYRIVKDGSGQHEAGRGRP